MNPISVGNNIHTLRKYLKLSQTQLAEKIGVTAQAVSKWENGESLPETYYLPLLSQILGVSIDDLLVEKSEPSNKTKGNICLDNIVKGIEEINKLKEYFGEDSLFYLGVIKGLNETMNLDFSYIYNNRKNLLYVEAIIQALHQGYTISKEGIEKLFNDNYKTYDSIRKYDTLYWENVFIKKVNEVKRNW